jgi:hypothetical protein
VASLLALRDAVASDAESSRAATSR